MSANSELSIAKSTRFTFNPEGIPEELKNYDQWVVWSLFEGVDNNGKKKNDKTPTYLSKGEIRRAKWSSPENMYTFDDAMELYESHPDFHGVGFVFTESDPFVGVDFDKLEPGDDRNRWLSYNTWSEFSQSGKGVHMIIKGSLEKPLKPITGEIEMYSKGRFFAMTGTLTANKCLTILEDQHLINTLRVTYIPEKDLDTLKSTAARFELPETVPDGTRDNVMYQYCCSLFAKGFEEDEVCIRAIKANKVNFEPPLEMTEVMAKIGNAKSFMEEQDRRSRQEIIERLDRDSDSNSELTRRYIFMRESGKIFDVNNKVSMSLQSFNQSMPEIATEGVDSKGKPKLMLLPPATYIKEQEDYRVVDGLGWMPIPHGKELDEKYLYIRNQGCTYVNKWRGFGVTPLAGDVKPWLRRLRSLIPCRKARKVIIRRMAIDVQRPHIKANWQTLIYGGYGAGKDSILRPLQQIFGESFKSMDGSSAIGNYDDELVGTKILLINEVENLGRDSKSNVWLKRNSSSEGTGTIMLNPKKEAKVLQANVSSLYLLSNEADCVRCDEHERRYYVAECSYKEITEAEKVDYFDNWLDKNGAAALFDFLLRVDTTKISAFTLPERTKAFYDMISMSKSDWEVKLTDLLERSEGCFANHLILPHMVIERHLSTLKFVPKEGTVAKWLKKNGFEKITAQPSKTVDGKRDKKSRSWMFSKEISPEFYDSTPKDLYEEIIKIEDIDWGFDEI